MSVESGRALIKAPATQALFLALLLAGPAIGQTPAPKMADGSAVIGVLDKRLGTTTEFRLKPGEKFEFGRLAGVMHVCEQTLPHEFKQTAAFVQVSEQPPAPRAGQTAPRRMIFSGWMFQESPSLNPFKHSVYDVWLKSCTIRVPDGPKPPSSSGATRAKKPAPTPAPVVEPATPASPDTSGAGEG